MRPPVPPAKPVAYLPSAPGRRGPIAAASPREPRSRPKTTARRPGEVAVRGQRVAEGPGEARAPRAGPRRAPTTCAAPSRPGRRARSAARSGRRAGRRRGSAARSSPTSASPRGRRPPTRSRTRRASRRRSRSQTSGSSGARKATAAGSPPGGRFFGDLPLGLREDRQLRGEHEPVAAHALDLDGREHPRSRSSGEQLRSGQPLGLVGSRRGVESEEDLGRAGPSRGDPRPGSGSGACGGTPPADFVARRAGPRGRGAPSGRRCAGSRRGVRCR